ncbi:hypothetical protein [Streptomyces sp. NPDC047061]
MLLTGEGEDGLVEVAQEHLRAVHPDLADTYGRDEILVFAY